MTIWLHVKLQSNGSGHRGWAGALLRHGVAKSRLCRCRVSILFLQVLTYYTMWNLYRNTNGAVGSTRMTKFLTQSGTSANIRVNYAAEPRWGPVPCDLWCSCSNICKVISSNTGLTCMTQNLANIARCDVVATWP